MPAKFNPYTQWLGIPENELPVNYYRLLGLKDFEPNVRLIKENARVRFEKLQDIAMGTEHVEDSQKLLNQISRAKVILLDPDKRGQYNDHLRNGGHDSVVMMTPDQQIPPDYQSKNNVTSSSKAEEIFDFGVRKIEPAPEPKKKSNRRQEQTKKTKPLPRRKKKSDLTFILGLAGIVALVGCASVVFLMKSGSVQIVSPFKTQSINQQMTKSVELKTSSTAALLKDGSTSGSGLPELNLDELEEDLSAVYQPTAEKQAKAKLESGPKKLSSSEGIPLGHRLQIDLKKRQFVTASELNFEEPGEQPYSSAFVFAAEPKQKQLKLGKNQSVAIRMEFESRDFSEQKAKTCTFQILAALAPVIFGKNKWPPARTQFGFVFHSQPREITEKGISKPAGFRCQTYCDRTRVVKGSFTSDQLKHDAFTVEIDFVTKGDWGKKRATIDYQMKLVMGNEELVTNDGSFRLGPNEDKLVVYFVKNKHSDLVVNKAQLIYPQP